MMESARLLLLVSELNCKKLWRLKDLVKFNVVSFLVEDGRMMADAEAGEFWGLFGGFAPLPKKPASSDDQTAESDGIKLLR